MLCVFQWNTVCLELPHCYLKWVSSGLVSELKRQNRHIPALAIASAVHERLNTLLPTNTDGPVDRSLMFSEAMRRKTFSKWPHMNYKLVQSFVCFTAEIFEQIISYQFCYDRFKSGLIDETVVTACNKKTGSTCDLQQVLHFCQSHPKNNLKQIQFTTNESQQNKTKMGYLREE